MAHVPVSQNAFHEFSHLIEEAHELLREAHDASGDEMSGKLAEAENKLNNMQALVCPVMVFA